MRKVVLAGILAVACCNFAMAQNCTERVSASQKGSLLFYSKVELRWNAAGALVQDTVISLLNDYPADVNVQMYFINGDAELDPVFSSGPMPILIAEGEPGWNWVDCALLLTPDQPVYWSAATGNPIGCQPFAILDPDLGNGPGRPDPEGSSDRVLRGYVIAYAIDASGNEICWNHLSGKATIINYADTSAWEYNAWAFQSVICDQGGTVHPDLGTLRMDGTEYQQSFDLLLFDFFSSGSQAFSRGGTTVTVDTDLTLHLLDGDFRENSEFPYNPPTTKAHFDIWNMNERKLSNTRRCITCWDQTLISNYGAPNNMLLGNMQSDKGKARIDGKQANECEENCLRTVTGDLMELEDIIDLLGDLFGEVDIRCSIEASLLGVAAKHLTFAGGARAVAGSNLVGMGCQSATIRTDLIDPPSTLREDAYSRIGRDATKATGTVRPSDRLQSVPTTKSSN
jgi:hypothetical protein